MLLHIAIANVLCIKLSSGFTLHEPHALNPIYRSSSRMVQQIPSPLVARSSSSSVHNRAFSISLRASTVETDPSSSTEEKVPKKAFLKSEREAIAKKKDYLRGAGVFKKVKRDVTDAMKEQFDSELMNEMKETPNFMLEKEGVELYLAKDHGFCWGVERSINLAYSAVETFPEAQLHITNELIHNPMVNDKLHAKNVNFIEKDGENVKDFSQIAEGDVVMLPAFGATLDEMRCMHQQII